MCKEMGNALSCIIYAIIDMCHVLASEALFDILMHVLYGCSSRVHSAVFCIMEVIARTPVII